MNFNKLSTTNDIYHNNNTPPNTTQIHGIKNRHYITREIITVANKFINLIVNNNIFIELSNNVADFKKIFEQTLKIEFLVEVSKIKNSKITNETIQEMVGNILTKILNNPETYFKGQKNNIKQLASNIKNSNININKTTIFSTQSPITPTHSPIHLM